MSDVSISSLMAAQMQNAAISSAYSDDSTSTQSSQSFASLLAEQLCGSDSASGDTSDVTDSSKELLMSMCLMMCAGGDTSSMMPSLLQAFSDSLDTAATSALGTSSINSVGQVAYSSTTGSAAVEAAKSRLGDPYSTTYRGQGDYVDCSSLVQWAYKQAGVDLPGTSVKQAKYCYDNGMEISKEDLQPGDLVFWSNTASNDGRWKQIHHVAIYAGDGKIVEAKTSTGGVVVDDIWGENGSKWKIAMYARPYGNTTSSSDTQQAQA